MNVLKRVGKWLKRQVEMMDPAQRYLAGATDVVDLENRMRALQRGEVKGLYPGRFDA